MVSSKMIILLYIGAAVSNDFFVDVEETESSENSLDIFVDVEETYSIESPLDRFAWYFYHRKTPLWSRRAFCCLTANAQSRCSSACASQDCAASCSVREWWYFIQNRLGNIFSGEVRRPLLCLCHLRVLRRGELHLHNNNHYNDNNNYNNHDNSINLPGPGGAVPGPHDDPGLVLLRPDMRPLQAHWRLLPSHTHIRESWSHLIIIADFSLTLLCMIKSDIFGPIEIHFLFKGLSKSASWIYCFFPR